MIVVFALFALGFVGIAWRIVGSFNNSQPGTHRFSEAFLVFVALLGVMLLGKIAGWDAAWFWTLVVIATALSVVVWLFQRFVGLMMITPLLGFGLAVALIIGAFSLATVNSGHAVRSHNNQTVYQPIGYVMACSGQENAVVTSALEQNGYKPGSFVVGSGHFRLSLPIVDHGGYGDFSAKPIVNGTELKAYLSSNNPSAIQQVEQAMTRTGATKAQVMDISNWVGFQLLVPSVWKGNTEFVNGQIETGPHLKVPAGDIGWMFVDPVACSIVLNNSDTSTLVSKVKTYVTRGPCANEEKTPPVPVSPTPTPTPPPHHCPCSSPSQVQIAPQLQNPGVYVGPTIGASTTPPTSTLGSTPQPSSADPTPNPSGYDSGSSSGSGTSQGSTCTTYEGVTTCTGGGASTSPTPTPNPQNGGDENNPSPSSTPPPQPAP